MEHATQHAMDWFNTEGFMPHGHCYLWTPELLWTYLVSETLIVLAYFSIPFGLMYFVSRRKDLKFNWMFKLFSLFIFACGTTHLMGIWTIWHPDYWLDALVKAVTAAVSLLAAVLLWRLMPRALNIPGTHQLEESNARLQAEVAQRSAVEAELSRLKQSSDERYRILFEQASIGVAEVDTVSGGVLHANQKFCEILGCSPDEVQDKNFESLIHTDDLSAALLNAHALKVERIPNLSMENRTSRRDGSTAWIEVSVSPTWKPGEFPSTHIAIVQDITARKQAEEKLQAKLDELQRWHEVTINRELRVQELKREVNEILARSGEPPRYASVSTGDQGV
ncbi:MAG: PAS domain S-box protein [Gallionella sp.]|nr:PAS domain S-box protein [Gallionella sp.]